MTATTDDRVRIVQATHPRLDVARFGFPLDHPYIESCWLPLLGPTSVAVVRRLAVVWVTDPAPVLDLDAFAPSFGVKRDVMRRALDRLVRFGFATFPTPDLLAVYVTAPPLSDRALDRVDGWVRARHAALIAAESPIPHPAIV